MRFSRVAAIRVLVAAGYCSPPPKSIDAPRYDPHDGLGGMAKKRRLSSARSGQLGLDYDRLSEKTRHAM